VTSPEAALSRIQRELTEAGAPFSLIGGLAVSVRAEHRFTRDADLAIAVGDDAQAEALVLRLHNAGYRIGTVLEQQHAGRMATVRLLAPDMSGERGRELAANLEALLLA